MSSSLQRRLALCVALAVPALLPGTAQATFPGHNGLIAFQDSTECEDQLQVMGEDGSNPTSLGPSSCDVDRDLPYLREWMPDGRHILLGTPGSGRFLLQEPTPGARPTRLPGRLTQREWATDTSVSPRGTRMAYVRWKDVRNGVIWTAKLDGTDRRKLGPGSFPLWSPDGRSLAYLEPFGDDAHTDGGGHLSLMDARTGRPIRRLKSAVVPNSAEPLTIDWAPDGRHLLLSTGRSLQIVRARDGASRTLEIPSGIEESGVFSPDGRSILYVQGRVAERDPEFGPSYRYSIRRISRSGGPSTRLYLGPRPDDPEVEAEEGTTGPPTVSWQPLP